MIGGLGVAGVAVGTVFGVLATSQWSASKTDCATSLQCTNHATAVTERNSAWTDATIADLGFAAGGVAIVTAAVLYFTAPVARPATGFAVAPVVAREGAGLAVTGTFE